MVYRAQFLGYKAFVRGNMMILRRFVSYYLAKLVGTFEASVRPLVETYSSTSLVELQQEEEVHYVEQKAIDEACRSKQDRIRYV